ncbi:MAG: DUF4912 domain-containing protein [bacterium]
MEVPEMIQDKEHIEESKYYTGYAEHIPKEEVRWDLPTGYNEDNVTIMVRDPWWIFAYWEVTQRKKEEIRREVGEEAWRNAKLILRIYDVTDVEDFNGRNANSFFDVEVTGDINSWYINVGAPNRSFRAEIGYLLPDERFSVVARSDEVSTPLEKISKAMDEQWAVVEERFLQLYGISEGWGIGLSSEELQERMEKQFGEQMASEGVGSFGTFERP